MKAVVSDQVRLFGESTIQKWYSKNVNLLGLDKEDVIR